MNIQNMHIAVRQGVDKINSLQADSLLSEEIDLELNKNMGKFINLKYGKNNVYGKGFEQSQKRIDDLSTLVKEYRGFTGFLDRERLAYSSNTFLYREFFTLPFDYMHHVESTCNALVRADCKTLEFRLEHFNDADFVYNAEYQDTSKVFYIPFSAIELEDAYVSTIYLKNGLEFAYNVFDAEEVGSYGSGGTSLSTVLWEYDGTFFETSADGTLVDVGHSYKDAVISDVLSNSHAQVDVYWETLGSEHIADTFIVIIKPGSTLYKMARTVEEAEAAEAALEEIGVEAGFYNGEYSETYPGAGGLQKEASHFATYARVGDTIDIIIEDVDTEDLVPQKRMPSSNTGLLNVASAGFDNLNGINKDFIGLNTVIKYVQHDDIHALLRDPFNKPGINYVLGVFTNRKIELYTTSKSSSSSELLPHSVKLKYLRNPLAVSLVSGVSCELPRHTHEEIVEMAISSLLEGFSDPRYKTHMNELNKNE